MNMGIELQIAKEQVSETGRILLKHGLVARTWGNVSARAQGGKMVITPSGMGYDNMKESDVVVIDIATGEWEGERKPSSEKGIHAGAYETFDDVNYVIHTHQNYATAISLAGFKTLDITAEERERLGGIAMAKYGLPGTKTLKKNVYKAYETGAKTIFLAHHGAVICGKDREDALEKSILLEEICKRNTLGLPEDGVTELGKVEAEILEGIRQKHKNVAVVNTNAGVKRADESGCIPAQVDDMAQIIGVKIPHAKKNLQDILHKLEKTDAVMVKDMGVVVKCSDPEDLEALRMLMEKAVICNLHTRALKVRGTLSIFDTLLMRRVYVTKYSKRK